MNQHKSCYYKTHKRLHGVRLKSHDAMPAGTAPPGAFVAAYGFVAGAQGGGPSIRIGIQVQVTGSVAAISSSGTSRSSSGSRRASLPWSRGLRAQDAAY